jgi:hypothetical protein
VLLCQLFEGLPNRLEKHCFKDDSPVEQPGCLTILVQRYAIQIFATMLSFSCIKRKEHTICIKTILTSLWPTLRKM